MARALVRERDIVQDLWPGRAMWYHPSPERHLPTNKQFLESVREWGGGGAFCLKYEVKGEEREGRRRHRRRKKLKEKENYFTGRMTRRVGGWEVGRVSGWEMGGEG